MIAQAGGLTYSLPQRQFAQQQAQPALPEAQQQEGTPFDIPMGEDLAYVENLTNNYYTSYGRLKDFTETMWKDYGVDVTKPDFTQPGGGLMHDTFLRMDADLRMAANDLAQQKKRTEEMAKLEAQGKVVRGMLPTGEVYDPTRMLERQFVDAQGRPVSAYVSTDLEDRTLKAIERANQEYYTTGDAAAANAAIQPIRNEYTRLIKENPYQAEYYQKQLNAIMDAQRKFSAGMLTAESKAKFATQGEQVKYLTMARKIANDWKGNWTQGVTYEYDPILKEQVAVVTPEAGLMLGKATVDGKEVDKIVKKYVKGSAGAVYAVFDNPKIPRERLDTMTTDEAVTAVLSKNPKFGGEKAVNYLNQFRGTEGTYDAADLYPDQQEYQQIVTQAQETTKDLPIKQQTLTKIKERVKLKMPTKAPFFLPDKSVSIKSLLADYPEISKMIPDARIETEKDGYKFTDSKGFKNITGLESGSNKIYSEDEIIDFLAKFVGEAVNLESPATTGTQTGTTKKSITAAQFSAAVKKYGLTDQQDIDTYRKELESKGYTIQ